MDACRSERQMAGWATLTRHFQLDEMEATHISMVTNGAYEGSVCVLCPDAMGDGVFLEGGGCRVSWCFSSASAQRTYRWGSHSRSAAS